MTNQAGYLNFIGVSPAMQSVYDRLKRMGASEARVLITGQTGTGKELAARALHDLGSRRDQPFIALNAAALPRELMESELFGHRRGAFTGAHRDHDGLIAEAKGGTLFLDEIGELDQGLQAKLLRFLETGKYRKVGDTMDATANVRIICATHRDLKACAAGGQFREDLYWRLNVINIHLPPLIARGDDILLLAKYFLEKIAALEKKSFAGFDDAAALMLRHHNYPGNVRELENIIHQAVILNDGPKITAEMLPLFAAHTGGADNVIPLKNAQPRPRPLWQVEAEAIEAALKWTKGNIPKAARLLEINPSTLYRKKTQGNQDSIK